MENCLKTNFVQKPNLNYLQSPGQITTFIQKFYTWLNNNLQWVYCDLRGMFLTKAAHKNNIKKYPTSLFLQLATHHDVISQFTTKQHRCIYLSHNLTKYEMVVDTS